LIRRVLRLFDSKCLYCGERHEVSYVQIETPDGLLTIRTCPKLAPQQPVAVDEPRPA
jgi:hypothetical protein